MTSRKPLSMAVHRALYSVAIASTAASAPGLAQEQDQGPPEALEEITVTGSRIATDPNLLISSPVTQVTAEELTYRGITRVEDLINDLPQITPALTSNEANGATGTATLDLRGLTPDRTLVLVNGHRMGFGDPFALAPDVNQIPGALVERIEVLTGGASSTYGSDAVAGVVNFIMKDDFEGFQVDYQFSAYQHNNDADLVQGAIAEAGFEQAPDSVNVGATHNVTLTAGVNTEDGRGNITAYLGYRDIEAVTQDEFDFSACALDSGGSITCGGSSTNPAGRFTDFGVAGQLGMLDPVTGQMVPTDIGDAALAGPYFDLSVEGDQFVEGFPLYNYGPLNHFQRPDERYTAGFFANYEINERMEGYAELMFMDDRSQAQIAPSGNFFVTSQINCVSPVTGERHPFLSDDQFADICLNDRVIAPDPDDEGPLGVGDDNPLTAANEAALAAGVQNCVNGTLVGCPLYIGRRNVEGGPRFDDIRHTSYRFLGGLRGDITDNWSYDAFANFSQLIYSETYFNDLSTTRIIRAIDVVADPATGDPVCRSVLTGVDPACVPWNLFEEGGVTQEAIDYLVKPLFSKGELTMDQFVGFINGDLSDYGIASPWANTGVEMVFGAEYRDESFDYNPDFGFQSGDGAGQGGPTVPVNGSRNVKELFTEFRVPVVEDAPMAEALTLDLRYRYSDYSLGNEANTYNIGGSWVPVEGIKFRGGFSRAVRAANIVELFTPINGGLWGGEDPCAGSDPELTREQCASTGVTSAQYGAVPVSPAGQYNGVFGGNPDLEPEQSDAITVGAVFTPDEWLPGASFSVDYWSIEVEDAISAVDPEFIIRQCGLTGGEELCSLISRGAGGNLWVNPANAFVTSTNVNIGFFEVSGVDVVGNYYLQTDGLGSFDFAFRGTWVEKFDIEQVPGAPVDECAGTFGGTCGRPRPEWKHTFNTVWTTPVEGLRAILGWRYVGEVSEYLAPGDAGPPGYIADAQQYLDLSGTYTTDWFGEETVLSAGVSNLTDNDPPVSGLFGNIGTFGNGNTIPGTWDALGRYWFVGFSTAF